MSRLGFGIALLLFGCTSNVSSFGGHPVDAPPGGDGPSGSDAAPSETGFKVSGKAMDYFAIAPTPVPAAALSTDGIDPPQTATAGADGAYAFPVVPAGSKLYLSGTAAANYTPTRNPTTTVEGADVVQDVYVMATNDIASKYASVGKSVIAGTGFVTVELRKNNGDPLVGAALTDIKFLDTATPPAPVPNVTPYFYAAGGSPDTAQTTSVVDTSGKARVALHAVPPGNYTFELTTQNAGGQPVVEDVAITVKADGATLARTGNLTGTGGGGGGGAQNPTFTTDIYPKLQRAGQGGLGCANCHTAGGPGAVLVYDGPAADVLASIKAAPGVLDLTTPANSLFLTKPLYEPTPPQNHPNATFVDINDPNYKLFLLWITQGAKP